MTSTADRVPPPDVPPPDAPLTDKTESLSPSKDLESKLQSTSATAAPRTTLSTRFKGQRFHHFRRVLSAITRAVISNTAPSESAGTDNETSSQRSASASNIIFSTKTGSAQGGSFKLSTLPSRQSTIPDAEREEQNKKAGKTAIGFDDSHEYVDAIVVDADWDQLIKQGTLHAAGRSSDILDEAFSHFESNYRGDSRRSFTSASWRPYENSDVRTHPIRLLNRLPAFSFLKHRVFPYVHHFFNSAFSDSEKETSFRREQWYAAKPTMLAVSLFYLAIWAVVLGLAPRPLSAYSKWTYGLSTALVVAPLFPLVALDGPRRMPWLWQISLWLAAWSLPVFSVIDPYQCGFYTSNSRCGSKDFVGIVFYPAALPVMALLLLDQSRLLHCFGLTVYVVLVSALLIPRKTTWARNMVNIILFHLVCIWASFLRESAARRLFSLRDQLKQQYRATQKAQVAERQASESKRKFVSYIFHEARVPLNTALIALQNLDGEDTFASIPAESRELVTALSSSLLMMEKVLNDVLDFNRMEAGRLVIQSRPFDFHAVFRALALAFRGAAEARHITLVPDLDPSIDEYCPTVKGDETRLLQILSNLLSNACKFTSSGTIQYTTRLLYPTREQREHALLPSVSSAGPRQSVQREQIPTTRRSSAVSGSDKDGNTSCQNSDLVIIRIEVIDSGVGIRRRELEDKTMRLFSPYVQTEIGQRQGGKGSGLGLALVRQIVKLSGGRLGVTSRVGRGSRFWCELAFDKVDAVCPAVPSMGLLPLPPDTLGAVPDDSQPDARPSAGGKTARTALVAAQIPIATDLEGIPITKLPDVEPDSQTPYDEDPYKILTCLVVDDDALTRKMMGRMLSRLGHRTFFAENGLAALMMMREAFTAGDEYKYQVVFLDNQMPVMNGVETVREVRRIGMRTYVCGLTGNALRDDQDEYKKAGLSYLLTKPLLERNLRIVLESARQMLRLVDGRPTSIRTT